MRIVDGGRVYRPLSSRAVYERDFVASVLRTADTIFPGHVVAPYEPIVDSEYGTAKPDLILVDRRLVRWSVVEVELEHHSLSGHVEPQIRVLANGRYEEHHASAAVRALPGLDGRGLRNLVLTQQPHVVVIAPAAKDRWRHALTALGATLMIIQVFEDDTGNRVYRVNGDTPPSDPPQVVGHARRVPGLPTALEVVGLAGELDQDEIDLMFDDELTRWRVLRPGGKLLLMPIGRCPLPDGSLERYKVLETADRGRRLEQVGN